VSVNDADYEEISKCIKTLILYESACY